MTFNDHAIRFGNGYSVTTGTADDCAATVRRYVTDDDPVLDEDGYEHIPGQPPIYRGLP